jgi:pimeloyl-ACP methyl ester carboxylesterase
MAAPSRSPLWNGIMAVVGVAILLLALVRLHAATSGLRVESTFVGDTPVTVFRPEQGPAGPVVLIAHGFAGSQQLMQAFATTFAKNGYTAVTFDLPGHGRNRSPLTGSITEVNGATRTLVASMAKVAAYARTLAPGPIMALAHSMATDVAVRFAEEAPDVNATILVSMFSPAITADRPRNLLIIDGDWETRLKAEALRAVGLATAPGPALPGVTYGDIALGTARRAAWSANVEHVGVLFSPASMREALAWIDAASGITGRQAPYLDARGPWIALLLVGIVLLARPLSRLLPVVSPVPVGAGLAWRQLALPIVLPPLLTPLLLRLLPTHFLPVLVADYLAVHFAVYGLLAVGGLAWVRSRGGGPRPVSHSASLARLAVAALALTLYVVVAFGGAMDRYVTSFAPSLARAPILLALLVGTLSFFLADEWLTRGARASRGAYAATKLAFVVSIGLAVALDFQRLFFLLIIVPVILVFFVIYGLFSAWAYRRTGHPFVGGIANAVGFAWAVGVTFPLVAG